MTTSKGDFDGYLKERYQKQVEWYDGKAILYKKLNNMIQIPVIVLAAIVPAFAALGFRWPTIVSSVIVSAGTGILKFGKYEEHWHNYRTICETLRKEKHFYDFKTDVYQEVANPETLFVERVESLISKENTDWCSISKREDDEK